MDLSVQQLETALIEIEGMVKEELYEEAYRKFYSVNNDIENIKYTISRTNREVEILAEFYSRFAYLLFACSEYDQFFEMYIKAQEYGYSPLKRREFLYEAFIKPNIDDFRINYKKNIEQIKYYNKCNKTLEYDELPYWLLTTGRQNEYFLYDEEKNLIKEKVFLGISDAKSQGIDKHAEFSDCLIVSSDFGNEVLDNMKNIISKGKRCYMIIEDVKKLLSCLQGNLFDQEYLSRLIIFKDYDNFRTYFINNNNYLPKLFIGKKDEQDKYREVLNDIHNYRLDRKNRFGDKVLLSICIPSYNRGKRAYENILHILKSNLDEEIEIILSNNGTMNESKKFYEKIRQIEDSRVVYFEFQSNQGMALNFCKAVDLASGRYILLLSDEDLLDLNRLQALIDDLSYRSNNISVVRVKSNKQGSVPFIGIKKPGVDALFTYMLTSNYMSGNIYNRDLLYKYNLIEYIRENQDNQACLYYPHMVWEIILSQYGYVVGLDNILIWEGQAEKTEFELAEVDVNKDIPYYATFEGRIGQHKGFYDVIKDLAISKDSFDTLRQLYKRLCGKTIFLVSLSIGAYYKQTDIDTDELLKATYVETLKHLEDIYEGNKERYRYKYKEDLEEIKGYYEYYKK